MAKAFLSHMPFYVDVIMVGTWMLGGNGSGHYHRWDMDALRKRMGLGGRYHGWDMDALRHDVLREKRLYRIGKKRRTKHTITPSIFKNHTRQRPVCAKTTRKCQGK